MGFLHLCVGSLNPKEGIPEETERTNHGPSNPLRESVPVLVIVYLKPDL